MKSDAYIFDLDGTLLNSLYVWEEIDFKFLAKRGFAVPDDYGVIISTMGFTNCAEYTKERFNLPDSVESIMAEWNEMALDVYENKIELKPFVFEYLNKLRSEGKRLGIATANHKKCFIPTLRRTGIIDFFEPDAIIDIDTVNSDKNSPEIYLTAAKVLHVEPTECIVFEDVLAAIKTAKGAGFKVCGVLDDIWGEHSTEIKSISDFTITSFSELL